MASARARWLRLAVAAVLAACGGGGKGGGAPAGGASIHGVATYDRVPTTAAAGLDFAATARRPIRSAVVRLADAATGATLAEASTDATGAYAIPVPAGAPAQVQVVVLARSAAPPIEVRDNTDGSLWAVVSAPFAPGEATKDLHAPSGWTGAAYDPAHRAAAPFAILDTALTAAAGFAAVRPVSFPALRLNWSPENVPQAGDPALGRIGTSRWDGLQLYLLGAEDVDTDEFDDHVIVHEWGHYFESRLSRSDSPGGPHAVDDRKDPRLAWSEGWGNALGAILLAPDTAYRDTAGPAQATTAIDDDLESNASGPGTADPSPGWWSEASIARILVDLVDAANEPGDPLALGLGPVHDGFVGPQRTTPALTTIFSFLAALKAANPAAAAGVDALTESRGFLVADAYGGGQARPGTASALYLAAAPPAGGTIVFAGSASNDVNENWYVRVTGAGAPVTVTATSAGDVAISVLRAGFPVLRADALDGPGTETATFTAAAGAEYVVVLTGFPAVPGDVFSADVAFSSP